MDSHEDAKEVTDIVYKTKTVHFLGRTVPIILQNDNGPCPLLAVCNVLLLRNHLNLSPDTTEVASSRLLALVAERLLDSNSNLENKDEEYARNIQQNISDAIGLLPNLATGLHVNVRFRHIHDFEFTRECAVFDLLDIGLVHGWIFDPQDELTAKVIGDNSYNTLVERLVELQTSRQDSTRITDAENEVDFAAATTATLRVPSPSREVLLKTNSVDKSDISELTEPVQLRKGDAEEAAQLLEALKFTKDEDLQNDIQSEPDTRLSDGPNAECAGNGQAPLDCVVKSSMTSEKELGELNDKQPCDLNVQVKSDNEPSNDGDGLSPDDHQENYNISTNSERLPSDDGLIVCSGPDETKVLEFQTATCCDAPLLDISSTQGVHDDQKEKHAWESNTLGSVSAVQNATCSSLRSTEPLYEGEGEVGTSDNGNREPLYEGEANLTNNQEQIGFREEGEIIDNFLKTHASQLTYYGLFCLQDGLKERELCVFFRNNHFNTMFKYNGQLYLLVTDQGYLNQPDIVWEKFDEVHGDTVFVTGTFEPFLGEQQSNGPWDEQNAIRATADFISQHQQSSPGITDTGFESNDLQLAMSLQQQEFEQQQQQQQQQQQHQHQTSRPSRPHSQTSAPNRLVTGPMRGSYSPKPDQKSKCVVM